MPSPRSNAVLAHRLPAGPHYAIFDPDSALTSQNRFMALFNPEVMHSGAFGSGKTRALCLKALQLSLLWAGNRGLLARKTLTSLEATTLQTLLKPDGALPPVIPPELIANHSYKYRTITLTNGSEILYGGVKSSSGDTSWINSLNLGWAAVDQAEELTYDEWRLVQGRLRHDTPKVRQLLGACNPRHPGHWIYQRFFVERAPGTAVVTSRTIDNHFLPEDYLERLRSFTGPFYERFVLGRWVGLEGLVYPHFDPLVHVIDAFPIPHSWTRYRAIDFGYQNPFVCLWAAVARAENPAHLPEGSIIIYRELYHARQKITDLADRVADLSAEERYAATFADHDAGDRAVLAARGIDTQPAVKDVTLGIQRVADYLGNPPEVAPRLYFFSDALVHRDQGLVLDPLTGEKRFAPTSTTEEFQFYRWAQPSEARNAREEPIKIHDHGMDALRYLLYTMDRPAALPATAKAINLYPTAPTRARRRPVQ